MHDDLQGTVVPSLLVQPHHESFPAPAASASSASVFPPATSSSLSSSLGLYGRGYGAGALEYSDDTHAPYHSAHAPWVPSPAPPPLPAAPPPRTFLSTGLMGRLSPSLSPVDGLPAAWPMPSSAAALTVGEVLGSLPDMPSSSSSFDHRPFAPLATQAGPDGGFEAEHVVEGPIGLAPRVKPFIAKLSHLVSQPHNFQDCVVWDGSGTSFIVSANERFVSDVLPRLFGHGNMASFTRQLNVYGFRRLSAAELVARVDIDTTDGYSAWSHPDFTRDDKSTLHRMTPRPSRARQLKKAKKHALDHMASSTSSSWTTRPRQRSTTDTTTSSGSSAASLNVSPAFAQWQPLPTDDPPLAPYLSLVTSPTSPSYAGGDPLSASSSGSSLFSLFPPTAEATPSSNALGLLRGVPARSLAPSSPHGILPPRS
ncbi:hypothetical protein JCM9279_003278 [Rhodotorula babjevae]